MINFFNDKTDFCFPYSFKKLCKEWLYKVASDENKIIKSLNIVITNDDELLKINQQFLKHNYYTDIITFDFSEKNNLTGELYLSLERINENASLYNQTQIQELKRVIIHGLLHLCGYSDKTDAEKRTMIEKENFYLKMFQ